MSKHNFDVNVDSGYTAVEWVSLERLKEKFLSAKNAETFFFKIQMIYMFVVC